MDGTTANQDAGHEATAMADIIARYLPEAEAQRSGIGLSLSGGGYRAALFHLGVLRRLNEVGVLSQVRTISCVSGGSILAAHLAAAVPEWPEPGLPIPGFNDAVVVPFERFVSRNLRTPPLARRLLPWNWRRDQTQIDALARLFERYLNARPLAQLSPKDPQFVFCASDNSFAVDWTFRRDEIGDYQAGYATTTPAWTVGRAVAASACFPPLFDPMRLGMSSKDFRRGHYPHVPKRDLLIAGLRLSDGGLYDNLALEPIWKDHLVVIASDGGAPLEVGADGGLLWRIKRYAQVMGRQATAIRKRWLIAGFVKKVMVGTYMGIGTLVANYPKGGRAYPDDVVTDYIATIRTDMDAFSRAEICVLQNQGYLVADAALRSHLDIPEVKITPAPVIVPYEEFMDPDLVKKELADSHTVKVPFGRGPWLRDLF
jgi:NTE family protein